MIKNKSLILLLLILVKLTTAVAEGKNMNVLQNQPVFKLKINTFSTKHIITVNGISVAKELDPDWQSDSTIPVNHLMRSGDNQIGIYVLPEKPGDKINSLSKVVISLIVYSKNNPDLIYPISEINFQGGLLEINAPISNSSKSAKLDSRKDFKSSDNGDVIIHDISIDKVPYYAGALKLTRKINISSSLPLWKFFESDNLPDYDSLNDQDYYIELEKLLEVYMKIQKAIESRDIDSILYLFSERNEELDLAFYEVKGTYNKKIKESLTDAANDEGLELVKLNKDFVNFTVEDNRKLASLTRNGLKAAIALNFKEGRGSQRYPLVFRFENNEWILSR